MEEKGRQKPSPEAEKNQSDKTKSPPAHHIKETIVGLWDSAWGFFELQSVGDDVKDHAPIIKKRVSVLMFMFILVVVIFNIKGCLDDADIRTANSFANSNSIVARIYESQLTAAHQKSLEDNMRANEITRNKDTEISNLKTENLSLNNRISILESAHVLEISSNVDGSISKILDNVKYPLADLRLQVNDETNLNITDAAPGDVVVIHNFVVLNTNREMHLRLWNWSKYPAVHSYVNFSGTFAPTNLVANGWVLQPTLSGVAHLRYNADSSIPRYTYWDISTVQIQTNLTQNELNVEIDVGSDNSEPKVYVIRLLIPTQ